MATPAAQEGTTPAAAAATASPFRVFFIPFFVPSHIIPTVDLARQFAARGVHSTVLLTPANAALARPTVDRAARSGHPIRVLTYPFPAAEAGLPEGQESLATVSPSDEEKVVRATSLVRASHERILREHRPDAVVADFWMTDMATDQLGIPRVTFICLGVFSLSVMHALTESRAHEQLAAADGDDGKPFVVPGLPDPVEMVRSELPVFLRRGDYLAGNADRMIKAQLEGFGVVVNSFYELEPGYADLYGRGYCRRAWFVGPLSLCYGEDEEAALAERGGGNTSSDRCVAWLDTQPPASVVFVCFGSWTRFSREQLREIALGLESSGRPFLWPVREEEEWLPEGFEERVGGRGLVAKGWAPQVVILNHPSVGAFVTHCGWNSVTEGVSAGVPMITWPLVFEQFINERLLVRLLRVGLRLYEGFRSTLWEEAAKLVVGREVIARVVARFAPGADEEVEEMRRRAKELAAAARAAVAEGGASHRDINCLIEELKTESFRLKEEAKAFLD